MMQPVDGYALVVPIEIRFKDIDMMGHVNNAVYLTYFENARAGYWRALGGRDGEWEHTYVLVHAECDYRSPATMQDRLGCNIRVVKFGNSSFVFEYVMRDDRDGRTVVEGQSVQAMYDYENRKVRPIDADFRDRVRRFEKRPVEGIDRVQAGPQRPGRRA